MKKCYLLPLNRLPCLSAPMIFPPWYCSSFCKYISSSMRTTSLSIFPLSRNSLIAFNGSTPPWLNFFKWVIDGSRNWGKSIHSVPLRTGMIIEEHNARGWVRILVHCPVFCSVVSSRFSSSNISVGIFFGSVVQHHHYFRHNSLCRKGSSQWSIFVSRGNLHPS